MAQQVLLPAPGDAGALAMKRRLPADGGESGAVEKQASFVRLGAQTVARLRWRGLSLAGL